MNNETTSPTLEQPLTTNPSDIDIHATDSSVPATHGDISQRILVVDDDARLRALLQRFLEDDGFVVRTAHDGAQMDKLMQRELFSLIVLDLMLPNEDGISICKRLRTENSDIPIIMLTAKGEEDNKVQGLDAGADDYLSKPFGIGELQARLRVAMRRHAGAQADEPLVRFADIEVDIPARRIVRGDDELHLTPIEFRLLVVLLNNPGKVLTQRQLLNQVWGPNAVEHSHYLRIYMGHLRQKLEVDPARPQHLLTETGIGYRFMP